MNVLKYHWTAFHSFKYEYFLDSEVSVLNQIYKIFASIKLTFYQGKTNERIGT